MMASSMLQFETKQVANLVLVENFLESLSEVVSNLSDRGDGSSTGGGGVDGPVAIHNNPRGDAAVHGSQIAGDEPAESVSIAHDASWSRWCAWPYKACHCECIVHA